jgi:uncharacterized protein YjbI with pentapeptide repeats
MSEFNELVKAFLLGNNFYFEESEKEINTLIISEMESRKGFMPRFFERLKIQKESIKIFLLDGFEDEIEINDDADLIIWNDSYTGNNLEEKIKGWRTGKNKKVTGSYKKKKNDKDLFQLDSRYLGMGKDILFSKFFGKQRENDLLGVGKVNVMSSDEVTPFFTEEKFGVVRFGVIPEESHEFQYVRHEYNRFMEYFCKEEGVLGQSMPVYFSSIDFWFGGMLHGQLTNRLNQNLGLFFTEDTVFYMVRLGYLVPFVDEIDLFCGEGFLNPQAPHVSHLFHLCGERGMFVVGCALDSILHEDVREGLDLKQLGIETEEQWRVTIAKPMGSRILEDKDNAELFPVRENKKSSGKNRDFFGDHESKLKYWIDDPDFPILQPAARENLLKLVAARWMEKDAYYLELEDFHGILFESDILLESKRTLAHIHDIVRAVMISNILVLSDFNQIVPVSRLMGETIILWMLITEFNDRNISMEHWLERSGFNQQIFRKFLDRLVSNGNKDKIIQMAMDALNIINGESIAKQIIENAFELFIAISNSPYVDSYKKYSIKTQSLHDIDMSHEILKNVNIENSDMHNILFQQSIFINCSFQGCDLASAYFAGSTFLNCRFEGNDLRNADFSGSSFTDCVLQGNIYDDLILLGCFFKGGDTKELRVNQEEKKQKNRIWTDGSTGIQDFNDESIYDIPMLIHLMQRNDMFYSKYGFRINTDIGFHHFDTPLGRVNNESFLSQFSYCDIYDEVNKRPELFFSKYGSVHYISGGVQKNYPVFRGQRIYLDHVIKHNSPDENDSTACGTKILFHTGSDSYVEENLEPDKWFRNPYAISNMFMGRGVSAIFPTPQKILVATDIGGLFLIEKKDDSWISVDSKFQSEPVNQIFPDTSENMVFVKRGSSVIEIWDTLNDLSLQGRLVTSFKEILGIRVIESLNHAIIYGEWAGCSFGAMVYNIIKKHLVTYWDVLSAEEFNNFGDSDFLILEKSYKKQVEELLVTLREKSSRSVSLEKGIIQKGSRELRQIMKTLEIVPQEILIYMEGEPVEFQWIIKSRMPDRIPINKTYTDIITGETVDFEFEIKIGDLLNVQSGKLKLVHKKDSIIVIWKENRLRKFKENIWGEHKVSFRISLLGQNETKDSIMKIIPKNPFRGGVALSREMNTDYLFVGRKQELKDALKLIEDDYCFTLKGARRIGKTSFINRLCENLPSNIWPVYISLDASESAVQSSTMLQTFDTLRGLKSRYPDIYREFMGDTDLPVFRNTLDFRWLIRRGIEKLYKAHPTELDEIWPTLETMIKDESDGGELYDVVIDFIKSRHNPPKIVFIIDEIGEAEKQGIDLKALLTPFRPIIERRGIVVVLAGIPYNFDELEVNADIKTDSGFMSYSSESIKLGPLEEEECRALILENLSKRIQISNDVVELALHLSAMRPEDLQYIMHHALDYVSKNERNKKKQSLSIKKNHIKIGFTALLEKRGYQCFTIWRNISRQGQVYIEKKVKSGELGNKGTMSLEFQSISIEEFAAHDISVFQGYGFSNSEGTQLVIPIYFQEWVRKELYKKDYKEEEEYYEN